MSSGKRGLGRGLNDLGLDELLSSVSPSVPTTTEELRQLPIEFLQRGKYQPRKEMDQVPLQELAESIRSQGIIQPILARPIGHNLYEIIAGERRWRAAQLAGLKDVPVVIRKIADESAIAMSLIENIQRENLNSIEEAEALQRLIDEFTMTHEQVAKVVGKSRASISNLLRLLQLNSDVKTMVERGDLEMGHARAMLALEGKLQTEAARVVVEKRLSVREAEALVKKYQHPPEKKSKYEDPDLLRLEHHLSDALGAPVKIQHTPSGQGKVLIKYNNLDELDGILEHFNVEVDA